VHIHFSSKQTPKRQKKERMEIMNTQEGGYDQPTQQQQEYEDENKDVIIDEEDPDLPPNWIPLLAEDDSIYFYNVKSRCSRWKIPKKRPDPQQVRASHILIKHKDVRNPISKGANNQNLPVQRTFEEALKIADDIRKEIGTDSKKFAEIAKAQSDCNSFERGGDLGKFVRHKMHKEFSDAAFELDIGEISGVIASPSGLHIILRTE
jgi:NIMA-interacting peptidyl-prolyl cis-trans isomerase 1